MAGPEPNPFHPLPHCTMPSRLFHRLCSHSLFIAASALGISASAQFAPNPPAQAAAPSPPPCAGRAGRPRAAGRGPGQPLWLGLQITHQPDWHTYWKNPGDSGLPTELTWQLPAGLDAGDIAWPVPHKIAIGTLANWLRRHRAAAVPVTVARPSPPAHWPRTLPCSSRPHGWCAARNASPKKATSPATAHPEHHRAAQRAFDAAQKAQPQPLAKPSAQQQAQVDGDALQVRVAGLPAALRGKTLDLFPEMPEVLHNCAPGTSSGGKATYGRPASRSPSNAATAPAPCPWCWPSACKAAPAPPRVPGRSDRAGPLAGRGRQGQRVARAGSSAQGQCGPGGQVGCPCGALRRIQPHAHRRTAGRLAGRAHPQPHALRVPGAGHQGGGLYPPRTRPARTAASAAWPTPPGGAVFPRAGCAHAGPAGCGRGRGWGFQLQSPAVVAALAGLFTLIGLNLAGVFEFETCCPSSVASLQARHPVADSFLTGVLAVAVASPCTAPFMAPPMGLTATLPAAQALAVFAALGLGLALPHLAASLPARRGTPRPALVRGWTPSAASWPSPCSPPWCGWCGCWASKAASMARPPADLAGRPGRWPGRWSCKAAHGAGWAAWPVAMVLLLWALAPNVTRMAEVATKPANATATAAQGWQPGPPAPRGLAASGRPVFVDFTAAWCVTCQYNKKTTLANAEVLADLHAKNVALLRPTGRAATPPSPPPWPSWAATACRCMCSTAQASPGGADRSAERGRSAQHHRAVVRP